MSDSGNGSTSDEFTVLLEGGRPWGFTLHGGAEFRSPLKIGKVTPGGRAEKSGLISGDIMISINGVPAARMKHHEAQRLIVSSKSTLELVCTKGLQGVALSPKSVTQGYTFDFPVTANGSSNKSNTLGSRHARQRSLDLNYRSRSFSDVGKRASVGMQIAGITVPPPPPKTRPAVTPTKKQEEEPQRIIAGIKVPKRPPSIKKRAISDSQLLPAKEQSREDSGIAVESSVSLLTNSTDSPTNEELEGSQSIETIQPSQQHTQPEIVSYKVELTNFHDVRCNENETQAKPDLPYEDKTEPESIQSVGVRSEEKNIPSSQPAPENHSEVLKSGKNDDWYKSMFQSMKKGAGEDLNVSKDKSNGLQSTAPGEEDSVTSSQSAEEEKSEEIFKSGRNDDWYKSMFQSMKKGVEEDLPNKKPVWDRSPVPARKSSYEFESKVSPNYKYKSLSYVSSAAARRRLSESSLPGPSATSTPHNKQPKVLTHTSSASSIGIYQKADVSSEVSPGVVYQMNTRKFKQSRNYWESIEKQASQEREEIAATQAKRSSLRRSLSATLTGIPISPEPTSPSKDISKSTEQTESPFFKEEVVNIISAYQSSLTKEDTENSSLPPTTAETGNTPEDMSKLHPLLKTGTENDETKPEDDLPQQDVFSRIDASKLNNAIGNASTLGTMSQQGVDPLTLQAVALNMGKGNTSEPQQSPARRKKPKSSKPPPGNKAKVSFAFEAASDRELSLEKGTIVNLTEQIDENWLKGEYNGRSGMFPISYVRVLSPKEESLLELGDDPTDEASLNQLARAKHDFTATTEKEVSLLKGDVITILREKDENWFEVRAADRSGIVPKSYVEIVDVGSDLQF